MARLPQNMFNRNQRAVFVRPRRRRLRRFRWSLVVIPAVILLTIYVLKNIEIGFTWDELCSRWGINDIPRFTMLACCGVVAVAVVAIAKVLRGDKEEQ